MVSVVIPTKNRPDSLVRTLSSVAGQSYRNVQLIIVDDGSEPPVKIASSAWVVRNPESCGASAAKNLGLEVARGEFVLFIDDDVELVGHDLIIRAVNFMNQHQNCAVLGFRQLDPDGLPRYEQPARVERPSATGRFFSYGCLARRASIIEVGGFENLFGYYYEENELAIRLLDAGYDVLYDPEMNVIHHYDERGRDWQRIHRLMLRNSGYTAILRYPSWCLFLVLPKYVKIYLASSFGIGWIECLRDLAQTLSEWAWALPALLRRRRPVRYATLIRMKQLNRFPYPIN